MFRTGPLYVPMQLRAYEPINGIKRAWKCIRILASGLSQVGSPSAPAPDHAGYFPNEVSRVDLVAG